MNWFPRKLVVVPIDFSEESVHAITTALQFVNSPVDVHVIHVLIPPDHSAPAVLWGSIDDASREKAALHHLNVFLKEHAIEGVTASVNHGDPGLGVTNYAKQTGADLIVIPSHGYHGIQRVLLGSVAERVIRHADCQVLVLRRGDAS